MGSLTSLIDISPDHMKEVCRILQKHLQPNVNVWVFGSRAKWMTHDGSDLDLAVEGDQPIDQTTMINLSIEFDDSDLPYTVDVVDLKTVSNNFKKIINTQKASLTFNAIQDVNNIIYEIKSFGECATLVRDSVSPMNFNGNIKYIGLEHIVENELYLSHTGLASDVSSTKTKFKNGDVLFGKLRPYFRKVINPKFDGICSTDIWVVRPKNNVVKKFLFYVMASPKFVEFATLGSEGTRMPRAVWSHVSKYQVFLPSEQEQKNIACVLGTLDAKIDLNHRMNETLEAMAQALFKSWFINFEPVRAKTDGRWRPGKSLPGLPARLYDLFPDKLVDSKLGSIPEGWTVNVFGNCFSLTMGQSPPSDTYNDEDEGLPFFQGSTDFGLRYPRNRKYCTSPARAARADDTLVSVRAPVGAINMAWEECCVGRGVAALRHKTGSRSFTYYFVWALQHDLKQYEQMGTVFGAITKKQFEMLPIVEPPDDLISYFETRVSAWDERIRLNTSESRSLMLHRDALLPKLISGEFRPANFIRPANGKNANETCVH